MGKKETIATTSSHSISTSLPEPESEINSSKRKAATIDLSQDSSSPSPFSISTFPDDSQNSGTTTQAANSQSSDVPIQSPVKTLGTISRKSTKTTSGNRMEVEFPRSLILISRY